MSALARMRLTGFLRTGRAFAPLIAGLVALGILYGGGASQAAEAYGVSAVLLFPLLAWQAKILLDVEPDVQRRLALVTVGSRVRELVAGLLAAAVAGLGTVLLALVVPWLIGGITGPKSPDDLPLAQGIALGVWAHLLAVLAATALGALASRAAVRSTLYGVAILASGSVGMVVLGLRGSIAPWLAPPVMATARTVTDSPSGVELAQLTTHAVIWTTVVVLGYAWLRRRRA